MTAAHTRTRGFELAGAASVLLGGALHVRLALDSYGTDDLVTMFLLNGLGSSLVAAAIVSGRLLAGALAGVGISLASLLALGLSRTGSGVLGFRGVGLDPAPDVALTLVAEAGAAVFLAAVLVTSRSEIADLARRLRRS